jgi:putative ABC transport system permease protein
VLLGIYGSVERRLREEFRAYGANIVAVPASGSTLPASVVDAARTLGAEASPFLVTALSGDIPVVQFDPKSAASMTAYWHVNGTRDLGPADCLAGEFLATQRGLQLGRPVPSAACTLRGIVSTGGPEDQELLLPFREPPAELSFVQIRAPGDRMDAVRAQLALNFPTVEFRTVLSVAATESAVVLKVRSALLLLTLVILGITTLCVTSNFSEMVAERSKEIGIMKALGGADGLIGAFFIAESAALALGAAIFGYILGIAVSGAIGRSIFGGAFRTEASSAVFGGVTLVILAVAVVATAVAASRIRRIDSATILRGE